MKKFLTREVKSDGKGIFVFFGGSRIRPQFRQFTKKKQKSGFEEGETVYMTSLFNNHEVIVLQNINSYEVWK